jgi:hypothetical protein
VRAAGRPLSIKTVPTSIPVVRISNGLAEIVYDYFPVLHSIDCASLRFVVEQRRSQRTLECSYISSYPPQLAMLKLLIINNLEARGVEPLSSKRSTQTSTCLSGGKV